MLTFYIPAFQAAASVCINKYLTAESYYVDVSFGICIVFFFLTEFEVGICYILMDPLFVCIHIPKTLVVTEACCRYNTVQLRKEEKQLIWTQDMPKRSHFSPFQTSFDPTTVASASFYWFSIGWQLCFKCLFLKKSKLSKFYLFFKVLYLCWFNLNWQIMLVKRE